MDYGEAIQVLKRANEKFEFPVKWGIDLQSEHERYLTEKYAKKPVIVMKVLTPQIGGAGSPRAGSVGGDQRQPGKIAAIARSIAG